MNAQDITYILREQAEKIFPDFNKNDWFASDRGQNNFHVLKGAFLEFGWHRYLIDIDKKTSYRVDLEIYKGWQGKGFGRKLVQMHENVCQELGIERIVIEMNENPSFWHHMKYMSMPESDVKTFSSEFKIKIIDDCLGRPIYKKLS